MNGLITLLVLSGSISGSFAQTQPNNNFNIKVIYGEDNRLDFYEVKGEAWKTRANSTVALMRRDRVEFKKNGDIKLPPEMIGDELRFCQEERFYDQIMAAHCSGSLVGKDLILTAGHCIRDEESCENTLFVFGYKMDSASKHPLELPGGNVYGCVQIVDRQQDNNGADWAILRINKPVTDRKPLGMELAPIQKGTEVVVIGHPTGLPVKIAGGAKVRSSSPESYFTVNADTYGGNSGSPVFNKKTGQVVGVLVRGENDYNMDEARGCRVSNWCADEECRGEDVTKVSAFYKVLDRARRATYY